MGLRRRGVDVLTVPEAGTLGASDGEQLRRARDEGRVIFTQDDDFLRLAATDSSHAGVVYATQERRIGQIIRGLMLIQEVLEAKRWPVAWSFCEQAIDWGRARLRSQGICAAVRCTIWRSRRTILATLDELHGAVEEAWFHSDTLSEEEVYRRFVQQRK